jgi:hypothetical protein
VKVDRKSRHSRNEQGIALLIAIFVLLLISVVAIALLVSSGTETALGANYRSSSTVYYAALAGLEEARGRLLPKNPNYFGASIISPGTTLPVGQALYVINPLSTETVAPGDSSNTYYDKEYYSEFTSAPSPQPFNSVWVGNPQGLPGPPYKWVRINAVTEKSLYMDVNQDTYFDPATPLFYDGTHLNLTSTGTQALEITALAALPNGSRKILQYLVAASPLNLNYPAAPSPPNLSFPAAVILDGTAPKFTAPTSASFFVKGTDQGSVGNCNPSAAPVKAIGYTDSGTSLSNFEQPSTPQGISVASPDLRGNYTGASPPSANPNIAQVTLSPPLSTVGGLDNLVNYIEQNADVVINRDATQADMPAAMSATNPMTIVVKGDLTFTAWHGTGYGLLLVTGNAANPTNPAFTYDPDAFWNGIILVIGKGWIKSYQASYTTTQIQGAVFVAKTVDASNNPLPLSSAPASSYFNFTSTSASNGIYYSSCWINAALSPIKYQVLSFREIPQ